MYLGATVSPSALYRIDGFVGCAADLLGLTGVLGRGLVPRAAALLYGSGFAVIALRALVPEAAVAVAALAAAAGLGVMSMALYSRVDTATRSLPVAP